MEEIVFKPGRTMAANEIAPISEEMLASNPIALASTEGVKAQIEAFNAGGCKQNIYGRAVDRRDAEWEA